MIPWKEFVAHVQATSHKLDSLAIFDLKGRPLVLTEGLEITEAEGRALLSCLSDVVLSRVRVVVDHVTYTIFQADADTLIGWGEDRTQLFVATRANTGGNGEGGGGEGTLVLAMAKSEAHGSCLFELRRFLTWRKQRNAQSVCSLGPTPLVPIPSGPPTPGFGDVGVPLTPSGEPARQPLISLDQVTVQMH